MMPFDDMSFLQFAKVVYLPFLPFIVGLVLLSICYGWDEKDKLRRARVCPNCGSTLNRCEAAKKRGCIACCPDCDHSGKGGAA